MDDGPDLSSLYHPQDTELAITKREKADCSQQLAEIQEQIRRLQLREESLKTQISRYDLVLAPFRRLPDDLLWEIFTQCLPPEKEIPLRLTRSQIPLLLMHVCRRWRMAAMACSSLWKYIRVSVCENTREGAERMRHMAELLSKSATHPSFDLRITWPGASSRFLSSDFFARVGQYVTGLGLCLIPIVTLTSLPPGSFPRLERLDISCSWDRREQGRELNLIQAFNGSSRLRQVALSGWFSEGKADFGGIRIALPWYQLTHVYNRSHHSKLKGLQYYFIHHLPQSTNLRYLRFTVPADDGIEPWAQFPTISLPNLQGLCMSFRDSYENEPLRFLRRLHFPNLKFLRLEGGECEPEIPGEYDELQTMMRSLGRLVHLSLQFDDMSLLKFKSILEGAPNVEILDLNLDLYASHDHPLEPLEWASGSDATLLPRLHSLVLRPWTVWNRAKAMIHLDRVIRSRMNRTLPEERLGKVVVYTENPGVDRDVGRLCVEYGSLDFMEHLTEGDGDNAWMKDDPFLHDWYEVHNQMNPHIFLDANR